MNIYSLKNKGVAGNIWKYILIYASNKRTYMTFVSIFLLTMPNATAQTIGLLSFLGNISGFMFEVPSGYLADRIGHKNAIIFGKLSLAISTSMYIFASSVVFFIIASILLASGLALLSGTLSAFLHDTLLSLGKENLYSKVKGKISSFGFTIPIIFILLLPFLVDTFSYRVAFVVALVIDLIGLYIAISLKNIKKYEKVKEFNLNEKENIFKQYFKIGWFKYVIFLSIIFSLLFAASAGFKNPFQESIGFSISMIGILWAFSRVGISGLSLLSGWFKKNLKLKHIILIQGVTYSFVMIGVSLFSNKWMIAILFIIGTIIMWGFSSVKNHFYLEYIQDSKYKASFLSINSFFEKIISAILSLLMGYLVLKGDYQFGFMIFGFITFIVVVVSLFYFRNKKKTI